MNSFRESVEELIKQDLAKGIPLKEVILNVGFHAIKGTNVYVMGYGINEDKALIIVVPD